MGEEKAKPGLQGAQTSGYMHIKCKPCSGLKFMRLMIIENEAQKVKIVSGRAFEKWLKEERRKRGIPDRD